jgi:hypothetical protein
MYDLEVLHLPKDSKLVKNKYVFSIKSIIKTLILEIA